MDIGQEAMHSFKESRGIGWALIPRSGLEGLLGTNRQKFNFRDS
jgi:hypothetical protein